MPILKDLKEVLHNRFPFASDMAAGQIKPSPLLLEISRQLGEWTDRYFQVKVRDIEHIPLDGGALIVSNHGFLMVESVVFHNVILRNAGRPLRPVVAHMVWDMPLLNQFFAAAGGIKGNSDTVVELLKAGELVLIYPGGVREAAKGSRDRERLFWEGRKGFVRAALRAQKPIVPAAIRGADDVYIRFGPDIRIFSELFGDKDAKLPLFMGLGPLPLPTPLTFVFGPPILMTYGPDAALDEMLVEKLHHDVQAAVEHLLGKPTDEPKKPVEP